MAKQINLFEFSGTLGNMVGYYNKGRYCIRRRPIRKKEPTPTQLIQQEKFGKATKFVTSLKRLLPATYKSYSRKITASNHLTRHILKYALEGSHSDFSIAYNKVPVTRGALLPVFSATVRSIMEQVEFRWNNETINGFAFPSDRSILVVYCEAFNCTIFTTSGPSRQTGIAAIGVPGLRGQTVHTWLGFVSENGKDVSNSVYTGQIIVG